MCMPISDRGCPDGAMKFLEDQGSTDGHKCVWEV